MSEQEWIDCFGEAVIEGLHKMNMTQRDLAIAAGLSDAAISYYVRKMKMPSPKAIVNIAYALDLDFNELMDFGDIIN